MFRSYSAWNLAKSRAMYLESLRPELDYINGECHWVRNLWCAMRTLAGHANLSIQLSDRRPQPLAANPGFLPQPTQRQGLFTTTLAIPTLAAGLPEVLTTRAALQPVSKLDKSDRVARQHSGLEVMGWAVLAAIGS